MASYPFCEQPNSVMRWNVLPYDDQFGYPLVGGRRFENRATLFFKHASSHPTTLLTQFEDFNLVNVDATDETKFVLQCCYGQ